MTFTELRMALMGDADELLRHPRWLDPQVVRRLTAVRRLVASDDGVVSKLLALLQEHDMPQVAFPDKQVMTSAGCPDGCHAACEAAMAAGIPWLAIIAAATKYGPTVWAIILDLFKPTTTPTA